MTEILTQISFLFHSGIVYTVVSVMFLAATAYYIWLARKAYLYVRDIRNLAIIKMGYDQKIPRHIRAQVLREYEEHDR